ncbi:MAG: T9SS type A sorting domain-containing protein, partial [Saprospiraceae bacterium]
NSDQVIGTPTSPQIFLADNKLEFEYVENAGWNWISFNLLTPDSTNLNNLLDELEAYPEDILKAQNNFADYNANYGWVGSLNGTQAGIKVEKSYRLYLAEGDTFTIDGYEINTEVRPVPVSIGWNWIGYLPQKNISINTALGNYNATPGDIMKGQTEFAVYDDVLGWVGSLESLKPGKGYMMSAAANGEIIYPRSTTDKGPGEGEDLTENEYWSVEKGAYPSNMTVIANLNYCEELITSDNFLLGAFLGKECRGLAIPSTLPETDGNVFYMTISGVDNEQIDYRLLNVETGEEISLMITETFASDTHKGSLEKPRLLTMPSSYDCKTIAEEESETLDDLNISVTPQLFQTQLSIRLDGEITEQELSVSMTDNLGRLVMQPKTFESSNEIIIKDGIENLPNGAYFLTVRLGDSVKTFKLIKIRA